MSVHAAHPHRHDATARPGDRIAARPLALISVASVLCLAGCVPVVATGPMTSEDRDVGAVTAVVLDTSGDLTIEEGTPGLVIHAPSGALDRLTTETDGNTLRLGTSPGPEIVVGEVRYELTVPDLESIELNGSGDIEATVSSAEALHVDLDGSGDVEWTGLDSDSVTIRVAGSGDVEVAGTSNQLEIALDGSGDISTDGLQVQDAAVSIAGSGNVSVSAGDTLSADISGSGRVTYFGDPAVNSEVSGSGDVVRGEP